MSLTRQIHLDFHCSEHINCIGESFDKKAFQESLSGAKVTSINLFAKCHHSWSYYPTKIGQMHPHLKFDLLGAQIEACKEIGIKVFIYFTVGWSSNDAECNPEWCARNNDGTFIINGEDADTKSNGNKALPFFYWKFMCLNTGYHELILSQVIELCENYQPDGFWFDIYQVHRLCYCERCKSSMASSKIDIEDNNAVEAHNASQIRHHCMELRNLIHQKIPEAKIFFNGTTSLEKGANFRQQMYKINTHQDLEDLPTTWGGYDKLPTQAKFFLNAGYSITAMSGKFHTEWGEFGGFKHPDALKYEAASMIASGANCNFGDQLHPRGFIDTSTYKNIAYAYDYVEQIEAYGVGGKPISKLGLWRSFDQDADEGISKMFLEKQVDFDVANFCGDFNKYEVLVFPSKSKLSNSEILEVKDFIKKGGSVITLGKSILNFIQDQIAKDFGVKYLQDSEFDCDYTLLREELHPSFVKTPFLNYQPATQVQPVGEANVLADVFEPYFNRTSEHYCSHQKTPFKESKAEYPAVVQNGKCIYIAHALDIIYHKNGARVHSDLFHSCLNILYKDPLVKVDMPSAARINLLHQVDQNRYVMHLLYGSPIRRGATSVIEDVVALRNTKVTFDFPENISLATLVPGCKNLEIHKDKSKYFVIIPEFETHCLIAFNYRL